MKLTAIVILLLTLTSFALGQNEKRKNYFPIWTFHQKDINIHGISVGLGSWSSEPLKTNTNGLKIELIGLGVLVPLIPHSPVAKNDSIYLVIAEKSRSERINGLSLSSSGTFCNCLTNGISAGVIGQINFQVNGASTSFFMNFAQKHNGLQLALFNESYYMNGLQVGLSNYGTKTKGIQLGASNFGLYTKGTQFGLFNKSDYHKGLQFGLWNINQKRRLPIFNWNFKSSKQSDE